MRFAIRCNDTSPEICVDLRDIKQIERADHGWSVRLVCVSSTRTDCSILFRISLILLFILMLPIPLDRNHLPQSPPDRNHLLLATDVGENAWVSDTGLSFLGSVLLLPPYPRVNLQATISRSNNSNRLLQKATTHQGRNCKLTPRRRTKYSQDTARTATPLSTMTHRLSRGYTWVLVPLYTKEGVEITQVQ